MVSRNLPRDGHARGSRGSRENPDGCGAQLSGAQRGPAVPKHQATGRKCGPPADGRGDPPDARRGHDHGGLAISQPTRLDVPGEPVVSWAAPTSSELQGVAGSADA